MTHRWQGYFIPMKLQREFELPLNDKKFLKRGTIIDVIIEGALPVKAEANGHGSVNTEGDVLRHWFQQLGEGAKFEVSVLNGALVLDPA